MKLILLSSFLPLLTFAAKQTTYKHKWCDFVIKDNDGKDHCRMFKSPVKQQPLENYDRTSKAQQLSYGFGDRNADGGDCPKSNKEDAYLKYQRTLHDFRVSTRVNLNVRSLDIKIPFTFKWGPKHKVPYNRIKITDGYSGKAELYHVSGSNGEILDRRMYLSPLEMQANGGFFFVTETRDESYLQFEFGSTKYKPNKALILTWLFTSTTAAGCPDQVGNTFQMVLLADHYAKHSSFRLVYNYGDIKIPQSNNVPTKVGFIDTRGNNYYLPVANGLSTPVPDDVTSLAFKRFVWYDFNLPPTELYNPPVEPDSCTVKEHCHCQPITTAQEMTWNLDVNTDVEFSGFCSLNTGSINYGAYRKRGHRCFVKPISNTCKDNGRFHQIFAQTFLPDGAQLSLQDVAVETFVCVIDHKKTIDGPAWERLATYEEKKMLKDMKVQTALGNREAIKKINDDASLWPGQKKWRIKQLTAPNKMDQMVSMMATREAKETTVVGCGWTCPHPDEWSGALIDLSRKIQDVNINIDRNGVWKCYDKANNLLSGNGDLKQGQYCQLTCPSGGIADAKQIITCLTWAKKRGQQQYVSKEMKKLARELNSKNWSC